MLSAVETLWGAGGRLTELVVSPLLTASRNIPYFVKHEPDS